MIQLKEGQKVIAENGDKYEIEKGDVLTESTSMEDLYLEAEDAYESAKNGSSSIAMLYTLAAKKAMQVFQQEDVELIDPSTKAIKKNMYVLVRGRLFIVTRVDNDHITCGVNNAKHLGSITISKNSKDIRYIVKF